MQDVVTTYLSSGAGHLSEQVWNERAPGDHVVRLRSVRLCTEDALLSEVVDIRQPIELQIEYMLLEEGHKFMPYVELMNEQGISLFTAADGDEAWRQRPRPAGRYRSSVLIPGNFLQEGMMFVSVAGRTLAPVVRRFRVQDAVTFRVVDSGAQDSARGDFYGPMPGVVRPLLKWSTETIHELSLSERA